MPKITEHDYYNFTPSESLVLEVLTARYRLGELSWTFDSSANRALKALEEKKLVTWKSASVEGASLVWFTDLGKAVCLSRKYSSHAGNEVVNKARKQINKISKNAKKIRKRIEASLPKED